MIRMNIYQLLPNFILGDGIGNEVMEIYNVLRREGYNTKVFADGIDPMISRDIAGPVCDMPLLSKDDIILYHLSIGTDLNQYLEKLSCRIIFRYHNITPASFFEPYNRLSAELCRRGEDELIELKEVPHYCLAVSEYNKQELIKVGYKCKIDVLPILLNYKKYDLPPSNEILQRYHDDYVNLIFVGRIAPNKRQDDVLKAYHMYKRLYNPKSRLFIVGSYSDEDLYYKEIIQLIERKGIEDVIITGHIPLEEEVAYYKLAHTFVCMSEHEGFCIPLVEAMYFGVPIIAYRSSAVAETLGENGVIVDSKDMNYIAKVINETMSAKTEINRSRKTICDKFSYEITRDKLLKYIKQF